MSPNCVDITIDMDSKGDPRAHSSARDPIMKRDRFFRHFKSSKNIITTSKESQTPTSEPSTTKDLKLSSSKREISTQVSLESRNSSLAVDQTQIQPQKEDRGNRDGTAIDGEGIQSQYLWMRAYNALEIRDPDLVAAYARYLDPSSDTSTAPAEPALSPKLIEAVIEKKLQDNEARKLVFHLGKESIKVLEQGEKIVKFILWSNDFISTAVSAQPYAALAWSGVSLLLPLLLNSSKQKEAMLTGLNHITYLLRVCKIREDLYLQAVDTPAHPDFMNAIVELYADIFEYQANMILYLSRSSIKRGIHSTFERDDWRGMLETVQNANARCTEYTALLDKDKEHRFYKEQSRQSTQIEQSVEVQKCILEAFEAFQDARKHDRRKDQEAKLLTTLASDYKGDKDSIPKRVAGTCEWVFEDKRFLDWRDNKRSSLLWISAGPGCGKSVLSRSLIDEKRLCTNVLTSTVCYFFFQDGQERRSKGSDAISAILHQLFDKKSGSSLLTHALLSHTSYGEKLQHMFSELWDVLIKSAKDPDAGEIVCVLDALDECEEIARIHLVEKLVDFVSTADRSENSSLTLKFLITSRPYEDLDLGFQPISSSDRFARFDGDEQLERIGQEIHLVIDAKVPYIAGAFSAEDRMKISDRLKRLDNRTYLWLFLTMNIIERSRSKYSKMSSLDKLLSGLPSTISDAYEKILSKSSDKDNAKILLQIVLAATRPLTLEEANIALSIATQVGSCKSHRSLELWPSTTFKSTIQNICGLFISVYDSKLFLIHQTAREFLICSSISQNESSREWEGCLNMPTAHGTISQICLHYLNLKDFATKQLDQPIDFITEEYPFLAYAAREWSGHYNSQDGQTAQSSRKAAGMLCRTSLAQFSYWCPIFRKAQYGNFLDNWTDLGIASQLGLIYVVEDFLNEKSDVNAFNGEWGHYGTALMMASAEGHKEIVEMLLNQNAKVNAEGGEYGTALIAAVFEGRERIIEMLLKQNANVNVESVVFGTALIAAASEGRERIVEVLLNHNANVNAEGGDYGSALIAAAVDGSEKILEMLLNHNADVNAESGDYGTALIAAASEGSEKIVELLLNQNADVNANCGAFGTALIAAAVGRAESIVRMLLNYNANVNAEGGDYGTALIAAARRGSEKIVELLLNQNADVNAICRPYGTALIAAAVGRAESIVRMLLNQNADVDANYEPRGTALIAAASEGREKIVELLLNQNADVNANCGSYGTALIAAAVRGSEKIAEMLLNQNADVDANYEPRGTALIAAASEGREKIVELLLNQNADVNANCGSYGTALVAAAVGGSEKIVELLLNQNADVNAEGGLYGTALIAAAGGGSEKIVEMLLSQNADVNAEVGGHGTALIAAAGGGSEKIVEMLLNHNADVNANCGSYGTALIAAVTQEYKVKRKVMSYGNNTGSNGHQKVIEILLKRSPDIDFEGEMYQSAIKKASCHNRIESAEILLDMMIDSNVKVESYCNALDAALKAVFQAKTSSKSLNVAEAEDEDEDDSEDEMERSAKKHIKFLRELPVKHSRSERIAMIEMLMERKRKVSTEGLYLTIHSRNTSIPTTSEGLSL